MSPRPVFLQSPLYQLIYLLRFLYCDIYDSHDLVRNERDTTSLLDDAEFALRVQRDREYTRSEALFE